MPKPRRKTPAPTPADLYAQANALHPQPDGSARYTPLVRTLDSSRTEWYWHDTETGRRGGHAPDEMTAAKKCLTSARLSASGRQTRRKGTPRDTSKARARAAEVLRDPLGRVSEKARLLMAQEVWDWANTLTPEERGDILAAEYRRRQK